MEQFPVGGSKDAVFSFMQQQGFLMSRHSDKCWLRPADGIEAHIYGVGSMARIFNQDGKLLCDDKISKAVKRSYAASSPEEKKDG
jgi:xylose isomerase